jgi:phosphoribosylformylglycinamidine synthase
MADTRLAAEEDVSPALAAQHGLTPEEYEAICRHMGRGPNLTELGIWSAMWSEHCSYKSSRVWLKTFPTTGHQVVQGPGENAGIVDIGDGQVAVFKMESHNHPSFIEPYQGAATGVGGILRDVFTMGARPIALLNALRFGSPGEPRMRHLISGVVSGIGGYGNCIGVPTVGGEVNFHASYNGNILVNAMCVGLARRDRIFYSAARGVGNSVIYVGSKTGRDGIHGATMASAEFDDGAQAKRPTVQVGDPFTEKLLLEACLELMSSDAVIAIQDMGAAGLTSSSVEMAEKGDVGIELNLDNVPTREENMTAYEMMLSESQERMLVVLKPGSEAAAKAIFEKWELDFAVIGRTTDTHHLVLRQHGKIVADIPLSALANKAPQYRRPFNETNPPPALAATDIPAPADLGATFKRLMGSPDLASRRWVWEQYDHMVMGDTVQRPGGDAAVVRVHGSSKALALTTDVTPRYCAADPLMGGRQAVAEAWRNLVAVGARPLAITDCLNFGNPERPNVMGQFVGCVRGMTEACLALDFPVISGNVSLYNETNGRAILPTPAVGGVGLIDNLAHMASMPFKAEGEEIFLLGHWPQHLGQSIYLREIEGREDGPPPPVDLEMERKHGEFVRKAIVQHLLTAVHDISDGGLLVALGEMALAGDTGARIGIPQDAGPLHGILFGEDQARYLLCAQAGKAQLLADSARREGLPLYRLGVTGSRHLTLNGQMLTSIEELRERHEGWFPALMA